MSQAPKFESLEAMSDEELRKTYDRLAEGTMVGTNFYLDELTRREALRIERSALELAERSQRTTETMRQLTWVILGATVVNIALVALSLLR